MTLEQEQFNHLQDLISNQTDNIISLADEQEIEEQRERWELSKLKKKYERVAEKDKC